ncbi:MAG: hypothetical protein BAJATHORv1_20132 [Candidatus Thorarchaeota archaeon]|nr:MAG: hypothetical protein BAJATHORv1_20132 [Candidatus Thorarchaeota archaeon]
MIQNEVLVARHSIPDQDRVSPSAVTWEANALMSKIVHKTMNGIKNGPVRIFRNFQS